MRTKESIVITDAIDEAQSGAWLKIIKEEFKSSLNNYQIPHVDETVLMTKYSMIHQALMELSRIYCKNVRYFDVRGVSSVTFQKLDEFFPNPNSWNTPLRPSFQLPYDDKLNIIIPLSHEDSYEGGSIHIPDEYVQLPYETRVAGGATILPTYVPYKTDKIVSGELYRVVANIYGPKLV